MKQVRPEPEYFRVGFYGKGFPSSVRVSPLTKNLLTEGEYVFDFASGVKLHSRCVGFARTLLALDRLLTSF